MEKVRTRLSRYYQSSIQPRTDEWDIIKGEVLLLCGARLFLRIHSAGR
nr:hypothetical protein [Wolbachia endosymbiont of Ctenocephalides felis wCfeT]